MPLITNYHVLFYGGPDGYQTNRSQIALYDSPNHVAAYVRFNDPGMVFEADTQSGGVILMYLPSSCFASVIDLLRNESPINVYFNAGKALLGTGSIEPVGEGE